MKKNKTLAELISKAGSSELSVRNRAAGKLMTFAEASPAKTVELLSALRHAHDPRMILGITGAPGSGKSMFTDRLISEFHSRDPKMQIGVIAVDPSSPYSGGALLGDRVRMMRHAVDPNVFIRSVATRGQLGGITLGTFGAVRVLGLIGCDIVIIETVGVGQMEFSIREVSDIVAIVLAPGQGDTVQFLKAGLMEIGDVFVVNKYDRPDAKRFLAQLKDALGFSCPVLKEVFPASARDNTGIKEFVEYAASSAEKNHSKWNKLRIERLRKRVHRVILGEIYSKAESALSKKAFDPAEEILSERETLRHAADDLLWRLSWT